MTERSRLLTILRPAFLVAVVVFAWLGLRGRLDEVGDALRDTSPAGMVGALALVLLGLGATGLLWLRLMSGLGARLPTRDGLATFFVGQLGKYIPGSVWSIGAQAQMAGRHAVPPRATVAAGLLFLGYHVATAVVVGSVTMLSGRLDSPWPAWVSVLALVVSLIGLLPPVVRWLGRRVAGREVAIDLVDTVVAVVLMAVAWICLRRGARAALPRPALAGCRGVRRRLRAGVRRRRRGRGRTRRRRGARGALRAAAHPASRRGRRHRARPAGPGRAHGRGRGHGGRVVVRRAADRGYLLCPSPSRIRSSVNSNSVWLSHQPSGSSSWSCSSAATIAVR